jgi:hypothetical protein
MSKESCSSAKKFDIKSFNPNQYDRIEDMPKEARGYFMSVPRGRRKSLGLSFEPNYKFYWDGGSIREYRAKKIDDM